MKNQLLSSFSFKGKTISATLEYNDSLYLGFTDNTFAIIRVIYDNGPNRVAVKDVIWDMDKEALPICKVGGMTNDEYRHFIEEQERKQKEFVAKSQAYLVEERTKRELAELKRLKEKYENAESKEEGTHSLSK